MPICFTTDGNEDDLMREDHFGRDGFSFPWLLPIAIYQNENKTKIKQKVQCVSPIWAS
jgi:hypothetical protein